MIVPLALRIAATQALTGATLAEGRVFDSAVLPIDELMAEVPKPVLVVVTDDETANVSGRDVLAGDRTLDLVIEIAVAGAVSVPTDDPNGPSTILVRVPETDAGLELSVNILARQVARVLWEGGGAWGRVFRTLASHVTRVTSRRGAGAKGTRFAARQIVYSLSPLAEPPFGAPLDGVWADFLAAIRGDPATAGLGDVIEAVIVGTEIPDWRRVYSVLGYDDATGYRIGLGPFIDPTEQPATLTEVIVEGTTYTAADADEQFPEEP